MTEFKSAPLPDTQLRYVPLSQAGDVARLPTTVKILLEGVLRAAANGNAAERDATALAKYPAAAPADASVPFRPSRILLQDYTGVPAAVDLAAMRAAMQRAGKDPARIEPLIPVDLIIDHSVQADFFGAKDVYERNLEREYERNRERYSLLRWAGQAFKTFRVVPPGAGICHQVNLERLAEVVVVRNGVAMPDTLFGADSHTTMVNGLGVLGWGVGGIEAEAAMLGQPTYLPWPVVVGVKLVGKLPIGTTATDLVLTLTELFRKKGVVNKFIEFAGDGLSSLAVAERATVANMCPEYGATSALFPVDHQTLRYLEQTGRPRALIELRLGEAIGRRTQASARPCRSSDDLGLIHRAEADEGHHGSRPHRRAKASERRRADDGPARDGRDRRGRRTAARPSGERRLRRHRCDNELHKHLEPLGDDRGRSCREEGDRARPHREAAREDDPRPRLARRNALPRAVRSDAVLGEVGFLPRWLRMYDVHW